ncbi:DNA-binding anti-repressor SinI [Sediminibacillus albus]|uniref:Anti-repressor SinI n=1 Tax=Sediminibacillus albus TaxID=407036 RepID=A0A1G8YM72_9BACI|nr:DNA-binding anti-repressor SinI [Sediminibacillus albus]SDK03554.1 Anti-repressor SinI [Sediminibacillus albus]
MLETLDSSVLDKDWVQLMEEAKSIGLKVEDIRVFILQNTSMEEE